MKQVLKNKVILAIAFFAIFLSASAPAFAYDSTRVIPVELKFLGEVNDQFLFQLVLDGNAEENEFTVSITDKEGYVLHKEIIKGEKVSKRFILNADDLGDNTVKFLITSKKSNQTVVYEINHVSRVVQDVVVNKLK